MPEELSAWPVVERKAARFEPLFDGKVWKVAPGEFDYEPDELKALISAIKLAACKREPRVYVRCFVTLDDHLIVQRRGDDYVPRSTPTTRKAALKAQAVADGSGS